MPAPQTEVLITVDGSETGRFVLAPGDYVIGSSPVSHIRVDAESVSHAHAKLILNYDHALIEDLGSSNGTKVNGQPIPKDERTRLWPNQKIQVGTATIELRRLKHEVSELSLAPAQAVVKRVLPEEFLREKKYDIGGVVARGGMGAILDAREAAIERKVAMKVMLDTNDAGDIARFVAEAKVTGQLEHPNIVPVHELGVDENGQPYYTMKMVQGITLKKVLELLAAGTEATVKKYPLAALLTIFQKVCDAIAFAHSRGVIHRDLKPENIMLGDYGEALVMDWGLAKRLNGETGRRGDGETAGNSHKSPSLQVPESMQTLSGTIMGTPQFMAPEQARGEVEKVDARSDIYSLGAILYQILALRVSVNGKDAWEVVGKVGRGEIEALDSPRRSEAAKEKQVTAKGGTGAAPGNSVAPLLLRGHLPNSRIPDSLAAVVRKAMSLTRSARYQTVADLQRDIEAYQGGFATAAENAGAWKRFTLFVRRHKAASIGVAAVLLIGGTLGTKAAIEGRRAERALTDLKRQAPALRQLAESEASLQHFDSALDRLDAAFVLDPGHLPSYWRRAWLFIGMDRLADAADAIRLAQQKDPAHGELAAILPAVEKLAALPPTERWPVETARQLYDHLVKVGAAGETVTLAAKLTLGAKDKVKLVRARLDAWLGEGKGSVNVDPTGLLTVGIQSIPVETIEPLRGLPIDVLQANYTNITSLEPLRGMRLVGLFVSGTRVADISVLRGMPLRHVDLGATKVTDLLALKGAPLEEIGCPSLKIADFSPLRGAPLRIMKMGGNAASDLQFLADAPLDVLDATRNKISDLSPLRGKALKRLQVGGNPISDFSPLRGAPIEELVISITQITDLTPLLSLPKLEKLNVPQPGKLLEPLRHHPSLKSIGVAAGPYRPVAEFWADYDAQQAAGKK